MTGVSAQVAEIREIEAEIASLELANASAAGWGAAVGARSERLRGLRRRLAALKGQPSRASASDPVLRAAEIIRNHRQFAPTTIATLLHREGLLCDELAPAPKIDADPQSGEPDLALNTRNELHRRALVEDAGWTP